MHHAGVRIRICRLCKVRGKGNGQSADMPFYLCNLYNDVRTLNDR